MEIYFGAKKKWIIQPGNRRGGLAWAHDPEWRATRVAQSGMAGCRGARSGAVGREGAQSGVMDRRGARSDVVGREGVHTHC